MVVSLSSHLKDFLVVGLSPASAVDKGENEH